MQKVSAILNQGNWTENASGSFTAGTISRGWGTGNARGAGTIGIAGTHGVINTTAAGQTHLAQVLTPPVRPVLFYNRPQWILLSMFCGFLALGCSGLIFVQESFAVGSLMAFISMSLWIGTFFLFRRTALEDRRTYAEYQEKLSQSIWRWEEAMNRWNHLFYCQRCDHIYYPQSTYYSTPDKMNSLL